VGVRAVAWAGVLAACPRSGEGLQVALSSWLGGTPVRVRQRVGHWAALGTRQSLGGRARLGDTAVAGERYWDTAGLVVVEIGPLDKRAFDSLLPGSDARRTVESIVRTFLSRPLEFEIVTTLAAGELVRVQLGSDTAQLGRNALLGQVATGPRTY